ncbi:Os09g0368001 [Oryza sativa Japonica Group]|uniref:Os09g0368001 protein n=1 Tax=Oryza sativa subsp. japonica TaxID=39947 RepID=A0A0N7KQN9_ORYSJ|nr:Os09g0368001 [Oryza sativa Japonica Group]
MTTTRQLADPSMQAEDTRTNLNLAQLQCSSCFSSGSLELHIQIQCPCLLTLVQCQEAASWLLVGQSDISINRSTGNCNLTQWKALPAKGRRRRLVAGRVDVLRTYGRHP